MALPTKPRAALRVNPQSLVIYGLPKTGKTDIAAELTRNHGWLLMELEPGGADFVEATTIQCETLADIVSNGNEILEQGKPYKGIILDTVTKLEEMTLSYAGELYKQSPMGKNWTGNDVRDLPQGAGYSWTRKAFLQYFDYIKSLADNVIILGHVSAKMMEKNGEEVSVKELDLTGKLKSIVGAQVDAIAYCYRKKNETILSFNAGEESVVGNRAKHLAGKDIVIADSDDSDNMTYYWDKIYLRE